MTIPRKLRSAIGEAITRSLAHHDDRSLALAVGKTHAPLLVEVPDDWDAAKKVASRLKQASSRAVGTEIPGVVWSRGGAYIRIENQQHQKKVFHYIENHATKENAWVWEFRNSSQSWTSSKTVMTCSVEELRIDNHLPVTILNLVYDAVFWWCFFARASSSR